MAGPKQKVALVCDWLTLVGGAEQVIKSVHEIYPDAPIYTSQYRPKKIDWFRDADVRTGWMNVLPAGLRRFIPMFRNLYFSHLDLVEYDLVISITGAEAKAVRTRPDAIHISYMHAPTQYYWSLYDQYIERPGFGFLNPLARLVLKLLVGPLRKTDKKYSARPNYVIANSTYVADEIKKYYGRDSEVIFPPVKVDEFKGHDSNTKREGFVMAGRQAPWKRFDLAIEACKKAGDKLVVLGGGAEHDNLVKLASGHENISFVPTYSGPAELKKYLYSAEGFFFTSIEPFGITPIEALASGTPVIALKKGGSLDFIRGGENGIFFEKQTVSSLMSAIEKFKKTKFDYCKVADSAEQFSEQNFKKNMKEFIEKCLKN